MSENNAPTYDPEQDPDADPDQMNARQVADQPDQAEGEESDGARNQRPEAPPMS